MFYFTVMVHMESSMSPSFSSTKFSLIDRDIIWVTAHIRGGMERGMKWWKEGKLLNKKNTFEDYLAVGEFLIKNKYTSKKKIIGLEALQVVYCWGLL